MSGRTPLRRRQRALVPEAEEREDIVHGFQFADRRWLTYNINGLDVCPARGEDNFDRLAAALADLNARLRLPPELGDVGVAPSGRLLRETTVTHWPTRAGDIDVLLAVSGACRCDLPRTGRHGGVASVVRGHERDADAHRGCGRPAARGARSRLGPELL